CKDGTGAAARRTAVRNEDAAARRKARESVAPDARTAIRNDDTAARTKARRIAADARSRRKPIPWSPIVKESPVLACDHPLGVVDGRHTTASLQQLVCCLVYICNLCQILVCILGGVRRRPRV
ncbi:unnamed protein product, partial [Laminaria digitata]